MNYFMNPLLKDEELTHVCSAFQLGQIQYVKGTIGGSYNANVKMRTSQGVYVIRLLNHNITEEHLRYVRSILSILSHAGLPVLAPLRSQNEEDFIRLNGKLIQITPFARGYSFKCRAEQVFANGRMLRQFHDQLTCAQRGPTPNWSFYPSPMFFAEATDRLRSVSDANNEQISKICRWVFGVCAAWDEASKKLPMTVIHADWHFWNMFYSQNGEINCLFDFDFIQWGCRVHDVAYALWVIYMLLAEHSGLSLDETFLRGYGSLTDWERRILPFAIARISLFFLCYSAYSHDPKEKFQTQLKKHAPFLEWILTDGSRYLNRLTSDQPG